MSCTFKTQILTVDHSPRELLGSVLGAFNVIGCLGIIFFVQIGGFLFDYIGPPAPFVFTGVGNLFISAYALRMLKSEGCRGREGEIPGEDGVVSRHLL